jgi:hypothetical protein
MKTRQGIKALSIFFLALVLVSGCATAGISQPPAKTASDVGTPAGQTGVQAPDLVITDVFLDGCQISYKVKNIGNADAGATTSYLYMNGLNPPSGGSGYVGALKAGQEQTLSFSNFQWEGCTGATTARAAAAGIGGNSLSSLTPIQAGQHISYVDPSVNNTTVKVCANAKNEITEADSSNNCTTKIWGLLLYYDMLPVAHLATWINGSGSEPRGGIIGDQSGSYMEMTDGSLVVVPQQISQGWVQGYWGDFYMDIATRSNQSAAIKIPANTHFKATVGLADNAQGSDGVTFKFGLKDLTDNIVFLPGKTMTKPGQFENWDIDLSSYQGKTEYLILRVEAVNSPVNDFAVWKSAQLLQVNQ